MFDVAKMLGIQNPFEMDMDYRVFCYWQMYHELEISGQLHEKWEYYFARLLTIVSSYFGEGLSFKDALFEINLDRTAEDDEIEARKSADAFVGGR